MLNRRHGESRAAFLAAGALAVLLISGVQVGVGKHGDDDLVFTRPGAASARRGRSASSAPSALNPGVNCASGGRLQLKAVAAQIAPLHAYEQWDTVVPVAMSLRSFSFPAQAALIQHDAATIQAAERPDTAPGFLSSAGSVTFIDDSQPGGGGWTTPARAPGASAASTSPSMAQLLGLGRAERQLPSRGSGTAPICLTSSPSRWSRRTTSRRQSTRRGPRLLWPAQHLWSASTVGARESSISRSRRQTRPVAGCAATGASPPTAQPAAVAGRAFSAETRACGSSVQEPTCGSRPVDTTSFPNGQGTLALAAGDAAVRRNMSTPKQDDRSRQRAGDDRSDRPVGQTSRPRRRPRAPESPRRRPAGRAGPTSSAQLTAGPQVSKLALARAPRFQCTGLGPHQASCYAPNGRHRHSRESRRDQPPRRSIVSNPSAHRRKRSTFAHIANALRLPHDRGTSRGSRQDPCRHDATAKRSWSVNTTGRSRSTSAAATPGPSNASCWSSSSATASRSGATARSSTSLQVQRRVVLLPHTVLKAKRRVGHGQATTVNGYLGLDRRTASARPRGRP